MTASKDASLGQDNGVDVKTGKFEAVPGKPQPASRHGSGAATAGAPAAFALMVVWYIGMVRRGKGHTVKEHIPTAMRPPSAGLPSPPVLVALRGLTTN